MGKVRISLFTGWRFLLSGLIIVSNLAVLSARADDGAMTSAGPLAEDETTLQTEMNEVDREFKRSTPRTSSRHDTDLPVVGSLSKAARLARLEHAQELLGKHYRKSVVRNGERVKKINGMVYRWTRQQLPSKFRKDYQKIAQTIIDESLKHEFDPVFLMSVITNESQFDPMIVGSFGEIGLMQILPTTGKWIAEMYGLPWKGKKTLRDPVANIRLGAAFLAYLRTKFDSHARLYLAAYNMGQRNVQEALERNIWPRDYAANVMRYYVAYYSELQKNRKSRMAQNSFSNMKIVRGG